MSPWIQNIFVLTWVLKTKIITEKWDDIQTRCWEASAICLGYVKLREGVQYFEESPPTLWWFDDSLWWYMMIPIIKWVKGVLIFFKIQEFSKNSFKNTTSRTGSPEIWLFSNKVASFYFEGLKMGFEKAIPHKWVIFFSFWIPFNIHVENTRIVTLGQMWYSSTWLWFAKQENWLILKEHFLLA